MITFIIGTKAQVVKVAPIMQELASRGIVYRFILTGQHEETISDLLYAFKIREPDDVLVLKGESDTKIKLFKWLLSAVNSIKKREYIKSETSVILVHGDTVSTLFGALVGWFYKIPVGHIEAGLRSFKYFYPFPEEIIRILTSKLSSYHYCSSEWAAQNISHLSKKSEIINTRENTILDSLRFAIRTNLSEIDEIDYAVVSIHRYENLSNKFRFEHILSCIAEVSKLISLRFILHPVTENKLRNTRWHEKFNSSESIFLENRMDYLAFCKLLLGSKFLISDGGSNQEEASHLGLPCLLMREKSERKEGLEDNVVLSNYNLRVVLEFAEKHANNGWKIKKLPDIFPSQHIVNHLLNII